MLLESLLLALVFSADRRLCQTLSMLRQDTWVVVSQVVKNTCWKMDRHCDIEVSHSKHRHLQWSDSLTSPFSTELKELTTCYTPDLFTSPRVSLSPEVDSNLDADY